MQITFLKFKVQQQTRFLRRKGEFFSSNNRVKKRGFADIGATNKSKLRKPIRGASLSVDTAFNEVSLRNLSVPSVLNSVQYWNPSRFSYSTKRQCRKRHRYLVQSFSIEIGTWVSSGISRLWVGIGMGSDVVESVDLSAEKRVDVIFVASLGLGRRLKWV